MKMKKLFAGFMAAVLGTAVLAGCGGGGSDAGTSGGAASGADAPAAAESAGMHVGMIVPTLSDEFQINLTDNVKAWCDEKGYHCDIASYELDAKELVTQIENMAALGVSNMYVAPLDPGVTEDALKGIQGEDIDVTVVAGTGINPEYYDFNLDLDQFGSGQKVAEIAAAWIDKTFPDAADGSIEIAVFLSTANAAVGKRGEGLLTIEELTPKAKIVEKYDLAAETNGEAKTQEYLDGAFLTHPDLKVVLCMSGTHALAANEAIMRTAGLNYGEIGLFSGDSLQAMFELMAASETNDSVLRGCCGFQDVAEAYEKYLSGEIDTSKITEDTKTYYLDLLPITLENLSNYYSG